MTSRRSLGSNRHEAWRKLVLARQHFTQRYWQARFPNDPESFALYRNSPLPPAEEAKMAADPEVAEATRCYDKAYALGLLRRATSEDDLQLAARSPERPRGHLRGAVG